MATVDLGKISFVNKGTYDASTTYEERDVVQFTDGALSSYVYVNATPASGQTPSTGGSVNSSHWNIFAGGVSLAVGNNKIVTTDGSGALSSLSGNNKILTTNSSGVPTALSIGSSGQALKVNSSANGYEFGSAGGVLQTVHAKTNTRYGISGSNSTQVTDLSANITPSSASNKILVTVALYWGGGNNSYGSFRLRRTIGGSNTFPDHLNGTANGSAVQGIIPASNVQSANQEHKQWSGVKVGYDDTHNTTGQITYTVTMHCQGSQGFQMNRTHNDASNNQSYNTSVHSTLTLQEVL